MIAVIGATLWLELRRKSLVLVILLPLWLMLCSLGVWSGTQQALRQQENALLLQQTAQEKQAEQLAKVQRREQGLQAQNKPLQPDTSISRNPALLAQRGIPAILAPTPMSWLSIGQSALLPQGLNITLDDPALLERFDNLQPPLQLWAGHFDLVFVLVYLMPLFLMLLSFDLHTSEQQNGTLRLLVMQAGSLLWLLAAKTLARLVVLGGFLVALTLWVWLLLRPWLGLDWSWSYWFLILAVVTLYGAFWLLLAAWLNCFRWPAVQVATSLATLWLLWSWLLPATGQQALQTLYPVPSRLSYLQQQREALELARRNSVQLLGAYLEDHPELAGGADNRYAMLQLSKAQKMAQAVRPIVLQYQQQLARQQALASGWIYLSPVSLLEQSLMHLAGSDLARYQIFEAQAHAFQKDWQAFFMPLISKGRALNSADFEQLPVFKDVIPETRDQTFWQFSAFLLTLFLLVLGITWRAWGRYSVI